VNRRFAEVTTAIVEPLYRATLAFNRHRLAEMIGYATGRPYHTDDPSWVLTKALAAASRVDPAAAAAEQIAGDALADRGHGLVREQDQVEVVHRDLRVGQRRADRGCVAGMRVDHHHLDPGPRTPRCGRRARPAPARTALVWPVCG
jgi:hypothetical protein